MDTHDYNVITNAKTLIADVPAPGAAGKIGREQAEAIVRVLQAEGFAIVAAPVKDKPLAASYLESGKNPEWIPTTTEPVRQQQNPYPQGQGFGVQQTGMQQGVAGQNTQSFPGQSGPVVPVR